MRIYIVYLWLALGAMLACSVPADAQVDTAWVRTYTGIISGDLAPTVLAPAPKDGVYLVGWITRPNNHHDFLIQRYDSSGSVLWERYHSGTGVLYKEDLPTDAVSDSAGNLYIAGTVTNNPNDWDAAVLKYSPDGELLWFDHFDYPGTPTMETPNLIRVTDGGDVYVAGAVVIGSYQIGNLLLRKYNTDGVLQWSLVTPSVGSALSLARGLAVDPKGNTYFTIMNSSWDDPGGMSVLSYDSSGSFRWRANFGDEMNVAPATRGLVLSADGNVLASGYFNDFAGSGGTVVAAIDSSGTLEWVHKAVSLGGLYSTSRPLHMKSGGGCYLLGVAFRDYGVTGIGGDGSEQWGRTIGGPWDSWDELTSSCLDADGRVIATGTFGIRSGRAGVETIMLRPSGAVVWESGFPEDGSDYTSVSDICASAHGTFYLAGATTGPPRAMYVARFRYSERPEVDLIPGVCPNIISTKSRNIGIPNMHPGPASLDQPITSVAILGTMAFDVSQADPATLTLAGVPPLGYSYADVSRPSDPLESACECTRLGADGFTDLVLRFHEDALIMALSPYTDGEAMQVSIKGRTKSDVPLSGTDCVIITDQPIHIGFLAGAEQQETPSGLVECRPNPFNASTTIAFTLESDQHVQLAVYNILGQRVATLVEADLPGGSHEATWNAAGSASGIYFVRLITPTGIQTKQMALVK